jgi:ComF family protein
MPRHVFYERAHADVARLLGPRRSRGLQRLLDASAHFVLPSWCSGCDQRLPWPPAPLGLCAACRRALPLPPALRCRACGDAAVSRPGGWLCASCERRPPAFEGLLAAWSYQPPIDEVIRRLKYGRLEFLAEDLAAGIAAAIREGKDFAGPAPLPGERPCQATDHDWVTPVPLHWRRRLARGYDQAALLARAVARELGLPYRPFLVRARSTPPQVARSAAGRRDNVAGAFRCRLRSATALTGSSLLLVDDVATTGATLNAASLALKAGGAARVTAAVAALTPPGRR